MSHSTMADVEILSRQHTNSTNPEEHPEIGIALYENPCGRCASLVCYSLLIHVFSRSRTVEGGGQVHEAYD